MSSAKSRRASSWRRERTTKGSMITGVAKWCWLTNVNDLCLVWAIAAALRPRARLIAENLCLRGSAAQTPAAAPSPVYLILPMPDWADIPIAALLRACSRVARVGAKSAGIILRCRRSEEVVSVGLGMMPHERRDAAARVRRASRERWQRRRGDGRPVPRHQLLDRLTPSRL